MGPKDHMHMRSYLTRSPYCPRRGGGGMGEVAAHRAKRLHTKEENIMPIVNRWNP